MNIGTVILAAGNSSRLGMPKQLLSYRGKPLLVRTCEAFMDANDGPLMVVTGYDHVSVGRSLMEHIDSSRLSLTHCPSWSEGQGTSLGFGARALCEAYPNLDGLMVSVCDQPHLSSDIISGLLHIFELNPTHPVACSYGNAIGPPACFPKDLLPELFCLRGEQGAKLILMNSRIPVKIHPFEAGSIDVDTPEDYHQIIKGNQ